MPAREVDVIVAGAGLAGLCAARASWPPGGARPARHPWNARRARRLGSQTVASWMRRNMATRAGRELLDLGIEAVWAAQAEEISLLHLLFYVHSGGSLERLAEPLGERVVLEAPVRRAPPRGGGRDRGGGGRGRQRAPRDPGDGANPRRRCYGCDLPPGAVTAYGPALRAPIGPLHWAGAEYGTVWNGYMDGAVSSGERSAKEVLAAV